MNDEEQQRFEADLRRTRPARLPKQFMARLQAAKPGAQASPWTRHQSMPGLFAWWRLGRWLAPAMALVVAGLLVGRERFSRENTPAKKPAAIAYSLKADDVQVDHELISSFDVVATLPGGQPVRFRCRRWKDQLLVTDKSRGVEIEQDSPRVEVVPVRFETY